MYTSTKCYVLPRSLTKVIHGAHGGITITRKWGHGHQKAVGLLFSGKQSAVGGRFDFGSVELYSSSVSRAV